MKPLEDVVRPALRQAAHQLSTRGAELLIDHDDFYNVENGERIPALHFQIIGKNDIRSMVYTFRVEGNLLLCDGDDGSKQPRGQRIGALGASVDSVSEAAVGSVISRAIGDIARQIQDRGVRAASPK